MVEVVKRNFLVVQLVATRDVVVVKLDMAGRQVVVASEYLSPGASAHTPASRANSKHEGLDVIILGDFRAKCSVWG